MIEFKTSKGEFVVKDMPVEFNPQEGYTFEIKNRNKEVIYSHTLICKLSQATEDDAKLIVDEYLYNTNSDEGDCEVYEDYKTGDICFTSALNSLQSLLKSKGIDINNGNWYLFKKI